MSERKRVTSECGSYGENESCKLLMKARLAIALYDQRVYPLIHKTEKLFDSFDVGWLDADTATDAAGYGEGSKYIHKNETHVDGTIE